MAGIKVTICCALVLAMLSVNRVDGQKCKTKWNYDFNWAENFVDYIIAYNISDTKTDQTCFDFIENYHGPADNVGTYVYKINGVTFKRDIEYSVDSNNQLVGIFKDSSNDRIEAYVEQVDKGLAVLYACSGTKEFTLVLYENTKPELAAAADELAKTLTDKNLADFKNNRDDC